jgi:hypothetical protein
LFVDIVRIALRRPYTFVVMALLILILGPLAALRMPTDIFPEIRIPVIAAAWQYTGLPPEQMAGRISNLYQRALTTTVNDIEHIEATSYAGIGIVKVFFQPGVDVAVANAQVTAISQTVVRQMPPGTQPPLILNYNASTVPIIQLALSGKGLSEQNLFDLGVNTVRPPLVTVPGAAIPWPYGGKQRQIQIDLDVPALQARGLSGQDVANALAAQNVLVPVGTQKIGDREYTVQLNNAAVALKDLGELPVRVVNGASVYLRDVAQVRDGNAPQTNIVHVDGGRSVLLSVLKNGATSTLAIVDGVRTKLASLKASLPANLEVAPINDQSIFVRAAISAVAVEGVIAAALTSLMILLFLGSWRPTLIIAISIPLSMMGAVIALAAFGETLNIMTLGGLALAVGILVDDATVTIENINWHLEQGKDVETAILDGARQIVVPAFVSLLCICIVFVPMFFLQGVARFLFVPMALSVMFAMAVLVPAVAHAGADHGPNYMLKPHVAAYRSAWQQHGASSRAQSAGALPARLRRALRARARRLSGMARNRARPSHRLRQRLHGGRAGELCAGAVPGPELLPGGRRRADPDPCARTGRHAGGGDRPCSFAQIQKEIRRVIPSDEIADAGRQHRAAAQQHQPHLQQHRRDRHAGRRHPDRAAQRPRADGRLRAHAARDVAAGVSRLRRSRFLPADIISQILNFGAPAPIDVQMRGRDLEGNFEHAGRAGPRDPPRARGGRCAHPAVACEPGASKVDVDRTRAQELGLTTRDVTNSAWSSTSPAAARWRRPTG